MSQKNYYRKTFTVTFYAESEEMLDQSFGKLAQEADTGAIIADASDKKIVTISPLEAAYGLLKAGSDTEFFMGLPDPDDFGANPEVQKSIDAVTQFDMNTPEFDEALGRLQATIGVNSGDHAALFFSRKDGYWRGMSTRARREMIEHYIEAEKFHADSAVSR
ncbi:hypothetical protein [Thioalkalivibrio sp. ALE16]|uniref:hypothetical protein n=1 Tax=Thioalkalivibrio sp. ALE16 TaxID=1158172 RepID=UPI000373349B|nr:hypothetical protein [Thioalkalivibrio sp. ALE16]